MKLRAKASVDSSQRRAGVLGRVFSGVFTTRAASKGGKGSGAPSVGRSRRSIHRGPVAAILATAALTAIVIFGVVPALADTAPQVQGVSAPSGTITEHTAKLKAEVNPGTGPSETEWHFEMSTAGSTGPWTPVEANKKLAADNTFHAVESEATGLTGNKRYWFRIVAENEEGGKVTTSSGANNFFAAGPKVRAPSVSNITETTALLKGEVNPGLEPGEAEWYFEISSTSNEGPWTTVGSKTKLASDNTYHVVEKEATVLTPSKKYWYRLVVEKTEAETERTFVNNFETIGPPRVLTFAVHGYHDGNIRLMGSIEPQGFENEVRFEIGLTTSYNDPKTPIINIPAASGFSQTRIVGADIDPENLVEGAVYHYRITTKSTSAGNPTVPGEDRTFVAPTPGPAGEPECSNDAFRTGASARLPDCRAYEQITPENKGAASDIYGYGALETSSGAGEDGNHFFLRAPSKWGSSSDPVQSYYVFSRNGTHAWDMASVTPQPEAGGIHYEPQIFNSDLSQTAIATREEPTLGSPGPESLLRVGPVGGPYTTAAVAEYSEEGFGEGGNQWVGASQDFSRAFLESHEHDLVSPPTTTTGSNHDLYEYDTGTGEFRQVNVISGVPIGTCGAKLVKGFQTYQSSYQTSASPHAVSPDGKKFLFTAVPSGECGFSAPTHIYMSVNGEPKEIAGVGVTFLGANEDLSKVLLQKGKEVLLYDAGTETTSKVFEFEGFFSIGENQAEPSVSLDASAVYFKAGKLLPEAPNISPDTQTVGEYGSSFGGARDLYRLDVDAKKLEFITQTGPPGPRPNLQEGGGYSVSRDGEQYYWAALSPTGGLPAGKSKTTQVYRYDNGERAVQCVGCSSPFNFSPQMQNNYIPAGTPASFLGLEVANGKPNVQIASDNGDFVFFNSPSQLVPQDVDGEVKPEPAAEGDYNTSTSSDVYEWRRNGVNGCTEIQGCLSLITSGRGGSRVMMVATTQSGNDVFFATHEKLVGQDTDDLGDIYDARVNGGYPGPAQPPAGCEGSSCQTPVPPPNDTSPGSMTQHAIGNLQQQRKKPCKKGKVRKHGKCVKKKGKKKNKRHHKRGGRR